MDSKKVQRFYTKDSTMFGSELIKVGDDIVSIIYYISDISEYINVYTKEGEVIRYYSIDRIYFE